MFHTPVMMTADATRVFGSQLFRLSIMIGAFASGPIGWAAAPVIYGTPAYQSPVAADPDDLLLLAGYGFSGDDTVVYRETEDAASPPRPPDTVPSRTTTESGVADIVSAVDSPYSLTIRLPVVVRRSRPYVLWVRSSDGEWSKGVTINDARPLWITPDEVYAHAQATPLSRRIKVVGRNLASRDGSTRIRLSGPGGIHLLTAARDPDLDRYVVSAVLPPVMTAGFYTVEISRDGGRWVPLAAPRGAATQRLRVLSDPAVPAEFAVGSFSFGPCDPSDAACHPVRSDCRADPGLDQTRCIAAAIRAAADAGGGEVIFAPGEWRVAGPGHWQPGHTMSSKGVSLDGILVPEGVSLRGAGSDVTRIVRGAGWDPVMPGVTLLGRNHVAGFTFHDDRRYRGVDRGSAFLSLGVRWDHVRLYPGMSAARISHVQISNNVFDRVYIAVGNGGLGIDHLHVTRNTIGAYITGLFWEGSLENPTYRYEFIDSVISDNVFHPGSYLDVPTRSGNVATQLSGGTRIDFSGNVADGTSSRFLDDPDHDARGWRAAFFWAMHDNVEMMLVSRNRATCTGDKDGDGEAIAYDNNHNRPGFASIVRPVISASNVSEGRSTITVSGALDGTQADYGGTISVGPVADYYTGDWLQVVQGPGLGQARKISAIRQESGVAGPSTTFTVSPAFDVLPRPGSAVTDSRLYWQVYTVGNEIDQRAPLCLKSNRTRQAGGLITQYAHMSDSVIAGNRQFDTSGILLVHQFEPVDTSVGVRMPASMVQGFTEIRDNLVSGTYDAADASAQAEYGIAAVFAASPHAEPPPVLSYGLSISHNTVQRAAGTKGAISFGPGWYTGPSGPATAGATPWQMADASLVFKNTLSGLDVPGHARLGIGISAGDRSAPIAWHTVLYGNTCSGGARPGGALMDWGTQTIRHCQAVIGNSCECVNPGTGLHPAADPPAIREPAGDPPASGSRHVTPK